MNVFKRWSEVDNLKMKKVYNCSVRGGDRMFHGSLLFVAAEDLRSAMKRSKRYTEKEHKTRMQIICN